MNELHDKLIKAKREIALYHFNDGREDEDDIPAMFARADAFIALGIERGNYDHELDKFKPLNANQKNDMKEGKTHYAQVERGNESTPHDEWGATICGMEEYESPVTDNWENVTCKKCLSRKPKHTKPVNYQRDYF